MAEAEVLVNKETLAERFRRVRSQSEALCADLQPEDFVVQPIVDVSPPKWHLGHTTWFFEQFVLSEHVPGYLLFDPNYGFVFNSYYETVGARVLRTNRGNLSRPTVNDVYAYRKHVNDALEAYLQGTIPDEIVALVELGLNHEEQHQELLAYDIKFILGHNPLFPSVKVPLKKPLQNASEGWLEMPEGRYQIGHQKESFCFDNELGVHEVWLPAYRLSTHLITKGEYLRFIEDGGYQNFRFWLSEAWAWVKENEVQSPLYWHKVNGAWHEYSYEGLNSVNLDQAVEHVSFFEADAYARWAGKRLPTEFEWEAAAGQLSHGHLWQWTNSAYLPYPGFKTADGAIGEYNGKFMINQMVLRGGSYATPQGHFRNTYRNFFHPHLRWLFAGFRLAE